METPHAAQSYAQIRSKLAESGKGKISSLHEFTPVGERPLGLMVGTNQSANVLWKSSDTHRSGGLAGMGKSNRGTLYETGF